MNVYELGVHKTCPICGGKWVRAAEFTEYNYCENALTTNCKGITGKDRTYYKHFALVIKDINRQHDYRQRRHSNSDKG